MMYGWIRRFARSFTTTGPEQMTAPNRVTAFKVRRCHQQQACAPPSDNANFATTMSGWRLPGTGRGLMASGDCFEDRSNCDKIFAELAYLQEVVRSNAARFRAALNWPSSKSFR